MLKLPKISPLIATSGWKQRARLVLSAVSGSFFSLLAIGALASHFYPDTEGLLMMAAFGSSAILIFTVPELVTAQPWPAIVGHVVSTLVGVFVRENLSFLPHFTAVPVALSLALLFMFMTRSLHPPAGSSSIVALNAEGVLASYGYGMAFFPMALGMMLLVCMAMLHLNLVAGRRYPRPRQSYSTVSVDSNKQP